MKKCPTDQKEAWCKRAFDEILRPRIADLSIRLRHDQKARCNHFKEELMMRYWTPERVSQMDLDGEEI